MDSKYQTKHLAPLEELSLSELSTQHRGLTNLVNSPEWDRYLEIMGGQMAVRKNNIAFTALTSYDEALAQEYQKGEVSGIYQSSFMLPTMIEAYKVEIDKKRAQEDKEDA